MPIETMEISLFDISTVKCNSFPNGENNKTIIQFNMGQI